MGTGVSQQSTLNISKLVSYHFMISDLHDYLANKCLAPPVFTNDEKQRSIKRSSAEAALWAKQGSCEPISHLKEHMQERDGSQASCSHLRARSREREIFSVELFIVKTIFEISKYFLIFLQGEFQEKLNKLESESENEGRGRHFGKFSYWHFSKEENA